MIKAKLYSVSTGDGANLLKSFINAKLDLIRGLDDEEVLKVFVGGMSVVITVFDGIGVHRYHIEREIFDNLIESTHIVDLYFDVEVF